MEMNNEQLVKEIKLFIRYSVAESEVEGAVRLVDSYQSEVYVLRLLREYYSTLPEAREEAVIKISEIANKQGVHLFVLVCTDHAYLYVVAQEDVLLLTEYPGEVSAEILSYFEFGSQKEFLAACPQVEELQGYKEDKTGGEEVKCPVCGVEVGETHVIGCVVEVCPWCDGQLCSCNCRFEQLETDEITDEEELETFIDMLSAKGRIPYHPQQSPGYPGTSDGLDSK